MAPSVEVTRDGITLDGRRFYLLSGCVHYFRWPRSEWRPLLEQARWAGLNTIDTVIPWNRHEPRPGVFDFAEEADLGAFLDLVHELGLKAIVRPGPYICAEWENGGLPAWLTAEPGLRLRTDDARYMGATLRWFDTLMPIIVPRQHTGGGPVILCQIENEHWASGVYAHDEHQLSLARAAEERGVTVPQYTCVGAMPGRPEFRNGWSGMGEKLAATRALWPDNPLIVSELWSGWFDNWGASRQTRKSAAKLDTILHQLTAVGCSGFSHWMWAGGTNFGYWGGRTVGGDSIHMTTSYDYDAPIDEYGRLTPKALVAVRHHRFLASLGADLAPVLADAAGGGLTVIGPPAVPGRSEAGAAPYRTARAGAGAPPAWRDFCCSFLQNPGLESATFQVFLPGAGPHLTVEVEPASIRPIFCNMPLGQSGAVLAYHTGRILCLEQAGEMSDDALMIYGSLGEQGTIGLRFPGAAPEVRANFDEPELRATVEGDTVHVRYWVAELGQELDLEVNGRAFHLIILSQELVDRMGLAEPARSTLLIGGPGPAAQIAPADPAPTRQRFQLELAPLAIAELADAEGWQAIEAPLPMERLGCDYGYGWYRADLELAEPLDETLVAPLLSDRATLLAGGEALGSLGVGPEGPAYSLPLRLGPGRHTLHILADNLGRFNYGMSLGEPKGLLDTLYLGGAEQEISGGWVALWQEAAFAGETIAAALPWALRPDAVDVHLGRFAHSGGTVWLLRAISPPPGRRTWLHLTGDRNSGALYLNGVAIERFSRHRSGGLIHADISDLLRPGRNVLALNIQGYAGAPWAARLISYDQSRPLPARWSFRGGVTPGQPLPAPHGPHFLRGAFRRDEIPAGAEALRLRPRGLGKGQIWLNRRNIGRFWQIGPQEEYKLPLSWLEERNELLIFAEAGPTPRAAELLVDLR